MIAHSETVIESKQFKQLLKCYRHDVPHVGEVDQAAVDRYLAEGRICRGWVVSAGERLFFNIVRSPACFPTKTASYARSEAEMVTLLVFMGYQNGIDFELIVKDSGESFAV